MLQAFTSAGPTRLELATSCVTGRRSNQLNYDPKCTLNFLKKGFQIYIYSILNAIIKINYSVPKDIPTDFAANTAWVSGCTNFCFEIASIILTGLISLPFRATILPNFFLDTRSMA